VPFIAFIIRAPHSKRTNIAPASTHLGYELLLRNLYNKCTAYAGGLQQINVLDDKYLANLYLANPPTKITVWPEIRKERIFGPFEEHSDCRKADSPRLG